MEYVIHIRREGECRRCGYCCEGCVHLVPKFEGVKPHFYKCDIYEERGEHCERCGMVHTCQDPNYPELLIRAVNPYCGYRFYEKQSGVEIIKLEAPDWEWLSKHAAK